MVLLLNICFLPKLMVKGVVCIDHPLAKATEAQLPMGGKKSASMGSRILHFMRHMHWLHPTADACCPPLTTDPLSCPNVQPARTPLFYSVTDDVRCLVLKKLLSKHVWL